MTQAVESSMRIFVAGATGVIGRRAIPKLLEAGHAVTAASRSEEKARSLRALGAVAQPVDLFDRDAVRSAVEGHDVVINLATHVPPSSKAFLASAWRENDRVRREVSRNLVGAALAADGVQRFVQESFAGIYADAGEAWIDEESRITPAPHARSVVDAEERAHEYAATGGTAVVLRFALLYGADSSYSLDTIRYVRRGLAATFGDADDFVSSIATEDAGAAVAAALSVPTGAYNVCDDEPVRRRAYFESLAEVLGVRPPRLAPSWIAKLFGSVGETIARSHRLSNAKLKSASEWRPRYRSVVDAWPDVVRQSAPASGG